MFTAMKFFHTGVLMSSQPPSLCALLLLFCFTADRVFSQQLSVWYNWFCESWSWVYREMANILISSVFICAFWVICLLQVDAPIIYFPTLFFFKDCFVDRLRGMMRERFWKSDLDRCMKWTFVSFVAGAECLLGHVVTALQSLVTNVSDSHQEIHCNSRRSQPDCSCVRLVKYSQISVNTKFNNSGLILS